MRALYGSRANLPRALPAAGAAAAVRRARFASGGGVALRTPRINSSSGGASSSLYNSRKVATAAASNDNADINAAPPGCARYTVELRRPLGIVLEQRGSSGGIFIAEITPGGNADRTGQVSKGDQLIATTGITYSRTEDYGGVKVRKGQEIVTLNVLNESFKTVSAAIGTHPASVPVRLTFQRCDDAAAAGTASTD